MFKDSQFYLLACNLFQASNFWKSQIVCFQNGDASIG